MGRVGLVGRLRRWYEQASLQTKFALQVVFSTTLLFSILLPLVLYVQRQAILSNVEDAGFQLAQVFARSSVQAVVADDYLVMQHVVNGIASNRRVRYAMLLEDNGRVLVHTRPNERGKRFDDPLSLQAARATAPLLQRFETSDGVPVYDFSVPVYVLDERRATARVGLSIQKELNEIARTRNYILLLGLGVLAVGLAWATYQARRLTRPVQALVRGTEAIARGNLAQRIVVQGGDELAQLAAAFNGMTQSVQALLETSRQLSSNLDLDPVLHSVVGHALDLVKADVAAIAPFDREAQVAPVRVVLGARTERAKTLVARPGLGLGGTVLTTGTPQRSADYLGDPDIRHDHLIDDVCREEGLVSMLAVPITLKGDIIGILWVANRSRTVFIDEHVDALERMANQAASAMEHARLYADTRLKTDRLEMWTGVSRAITGTLDTERIVPVIIDAVRDVMNDTVVRVWASRDDDGTLVALGSAGLRGPDFEFRVGRGEGLVGAVAASGRPLAIPDMRADARVLRPELVEREGLVSFLGLPLQREGRMLGVLSIATRTSHHFAADHLPLFASFAQQAAIALENARLYDDLKRSHADLVAAQEQLVRKTRMAAMGEIAAAVAHEARNPLGALSNCVQMLRGNPNLTGEDAELLEIVHTESQRLNEIVSDFLAFGRPRPPHLEEVDVTEVIEASLALLRRDVRCPAAITFTTKFDPALAPVQADRDQLRQVFWNLFLNAVQAMGDRGELRVETRSEGTRARISVHDTGPGIPGAALSRIFEPFYTTKAGGTGLGLAIVRRIVDEHGGDIRAESDPGIGASFTLIFDTSSGGV